MSITKIVLMSFVAIVGVVFFMRYNASVDTARNRCDSDTSKEQCWEDLTRETVNKKGVRAAFDLIAYLYDHDPAFAQPCHSLVHIIGQNAYRQFRASGKVPLSEHAASCAFGFYHGFMEMLVAQKGTIKEAQDFCTYVDDTLGSITPNAKFSCYHGIGHGATDVHNPKYYGDERALIVPALANCEAFATDEKQLTLCATGVFDSISIAYYNNGTNGFIMKKEDPLWLCHEQPVKYKEACYRDMMPAVIWMGEYDLVKAAPIVFTHVESEYRAFALEILAENSVRFIINKKPATIYVSYCRGLDEPYQSACVKGLASGVMQFGPPGREYEGALSFCRESLLTSQERTLCMEQVLRYTQTRYSQKKVADICSTVEEEYKTYCN